MTMTDNLLKRQFRARVKKLIADHDGTWMSLADEIGIPYGSLQAIVCSKIYLPNPKMTTLVKLAEYFDIELSWLILGDYSA